METVPLYIWDPFDTTNVTKRFISLDLLNIIFIYIVNSFVLTLKFFQIFLFPIYLIELNIMKLNILQR